MSNLPVRPSLTSLRKQAKSVLKGFRENNRDALARIREYHPQPDRFATLRDAQLVVARQYGHPGWTELCRAVEDALDNAQSLTERAALFTDLTCLLYASGDNISRRERAARILRESPEITTVDIYAAAAAFDVEATRRLLSEDPERVKRVGGPRDWAPLMYLAYSRVEEDPPDRDARVVAQTLLEAGADADVDGSGITGGWRWTALTGIIGEGESGLLQQPPHLRARELAEMLLDAGANPNDSQGLYNSMFTPSNEWLELLLSRGLTANALADPESDSPVTTVDYQLASAVKNGLYDRVSLLLAHGADAAGSDEVYSGRTHVENARLHGHADIAALLLAKGAEEPEMSAEDQFRAAVMAGDEPKSKQLLLENPEFVNQQGLMTDAAGSGRVRTVQLLLDLGANPDLSAKNGRVALHEAAWSGRSQVIELMLERGASPDVREKDHNATPAGFANHAGQFDVRDLLLDHSRDVFDLTRFGKAERLRELFEENEDLAASSDEKGHTLLHHLGTVGPDGEATVDLLLEYGANINAKAKDGSTPLSIAQANENDEIADLLKKRGAL